MIEKDLTYLPLRMSVDHMGVGREFLTETKVPLLIYNDVQICYWSYEFLPSTSDNILIVTSISLWLMYG